MPKKFDQEQIKEKKECTHRWVMQQSISEQHCLICPAIAISEKEHNRRLEAWNEYYHTEVMETPAYITYQAMRYGMHNQEERERLLNEMDQHYKENGYLPKPSFPDPERFRYTVI